MIAYLEQAYMHIIGCKLEHTLDIQMKTKSQGKKLPGFQSQVQVKKVTGFQVIWLPNSASYFQQQIANWLYYLSLPSLPLGIHLKCSLLQLILAFESITGHSSTKNIEVFATLAARFQLLSVQMENTLSVPARILRSIFGRFRSPKTQEVERKKTESRSKPTSISNVKM